MTAKSGTKVDPRARAKDLVEAGIRSGRPGAQMLGRFLRVEREGRGETRSVTAKRLGVAPGVLGSWETGQTVPGQASMSRIRRWLGKDGAANLDALIASIKDGTVAVWTDPTPAERESARRFEAAVLAAAADGDPVPVEPVEPVEPVDPDARLLEAIMATAMTDRAKALLCAAVVTLAAGIDVEIEVRARV